MSSGHARGVMLVLISQKKANPSCLEGLILHPRRVRVPHAWASLVFYHCVSDPVGSPGNQPPACSWVLQLGRFEMFFDVRKRLCVQGKGQGTSSWAPACVGAGWSGSSTVLCSLWVLSGPLARCESHPSLFMSFSLCPVVFVDVLALLQTKSRGLSS